VVSELFFHFGLFHRPFPALYTYGAFGSTVIFLGFRNFNLQQGLFIYGLIGVFGAPKDADDTDMDESGIGMRIWAPIARPHRDMESKSSSSSSYSSSMCYLGCRLRFRKSAFDSYSVACETFWEKKTLLLRLLGFRIKLL
jgi:hypothetical protein